MTDQGHLWGNPGPEAPEPFEDAAGRMCGGARFHTLPPEDAEVAWLRLNQRIVVLRNQCALTDSVILRVL